MAQGLGELVNGRRHFETFIENSPLLPQPHVTGPFDKTGEVPFGWMSCLLPKFLDFSQMGELIAFLASRFFMTGDPGPPSSPLPSCLSAWWMAGGKNYTHFFNDAYE